MSGRIASKKEKQTSSGGSKIQNEASWRKNPWERGGGVSTSKSSSTSLEFVRMGRKGNNKEIVVLIVHD